MSKTVKWPVELDSEVIKNLDNANVVGTMCRTRIEGEDVVSFVPRQKARPYADLHPNEKRTTLPFGFVRKDDMGMVANLKFNFAADGRDEAMVRRAFRVYEDEAVKLLQE